MQSARLAIPSIGHLKTLKACLRRKRTRHHEDPWGREIVVLDAQPDLVPPNTFEDGNTPFYCFEHLSDSNGRTEDNFHRFGTPANDSARAKTGFPTRFNLVGWRILSHNPPRRYTRRAGRFAPRDCSLTSQIQYS